MLAFIDYNTHLGGDQLTKLDGKPVFVARFGKRTKQWYATPALPLDETHLDGVRVYPTKRFSPSASTSRARRSDAATFDKD